MIGHGSHLAALAKDAIYREPSWVPFVKSLVSWFLWPTSFLRPQYSRNSCQVKHASNINQSCLHVAYLQDFVSILSEYAIAHGPNRILTLFVGSSPEVMIWSTVTPGCGSGLWRKDARAPCKHGNGRFRRLVSNVFRWLEATKQIDLELRISLDRHLSHSQGTHAAQAHEFSKAWRLMAKPSTWRIVRSRCLG